MDVPLQLSRSLVDARARASQRGRQHWTAAFPRLEAWILSRPVSASSSGPTSEISSQAGEGDFEDNLLVSMPSPLVQQVLVVQAQNGVNMASGTAITAPSTATTAPSTAPLPLVGPSTMPMEPIVPIRAVYGTPAIRCHACYVSKAFLPNGFLWSRQSVPSISKSCHDLKLDQLDPSYFHILQYVQVSSELNHYFLSYHVHRQRRAHTQMGMSTL